MCIWIITASWRTKTCHEADLLIGIEQYELFFSVFGVLLAFLDWKLP